MRPIPLKCLVFGTGVAALAAFSASCNNSLGLPPALFPNTVDTATIYALRETAVTLPSAFDIVAGGPSRTDRAEPFDFAFNIDSTGTPYLYPAGALGLSPSPGILISSSPFDSILSAPNTTYQADSAVQIAVGTVFVGRSRPSSASCSFLGALPRYAKFQVLAIDQQARSVTFEVLIDPNCGYRDLVTGIPKQ